MLNKKNTVSGIHIGADTVRVVQMNYHADNETYRAGSAALSPVQGYFDAEERIRNNVQAINTCKNTIGRKIEKSGFYVTCMNWPDVIVSTFSLPEKSKQELERSLIGEIEQIYPSDLEKAVIDYHVISREKPEDPQQPARANGIIAISQQSSVQNYYSMMRRSGLKSIIIDTDSFALLNCFELLNERRDTAIINVDMSHTIIAIPRRDSVPFVRNIEYGGKNIINSVVKAKGIEKEDFTDSLQNAKESLSDDVLEVLKKSCDTLAQNVNRTLQYCLTQDENLEINHIYITGELSLMPIIVELLSEQMHWTMSQWNPFEKIDKKNITGQDLLDKTGSAFAIAAGLSMRRPEYV
ncbi:pilus assembly protein PilM [Sedimentisphaera salicampi]|uniref:Type IV pilus assembly protein PilM n=1 Tax=Sedimentisphaera salicampi TaxID=1941349 RepID=A0A1W6LIU7_9BACT|nr:pilus assembly protein PilM [Sedimentisphaera salicampi]ARN55720.1 type IV pilus assembly protein PilM [Sedimentisphaera salicampi]OXU16141.1 type IV pilus assembly protein PilM [Sedimentisphaera salicampi]